MARKDKLELPSLETPTPKQDPTPDKKGQGKAGVKKKNDGKKKINIGKVFREMISELKKVKWAPFKTTANNAGVLKQTGTVLIVTLFFLIIITLFDLGLTKLLDLLLSAANG